MLTRLTRLTRLTMYKGYTEARKAANLRYLDSKARIVLWCTPEEKEAISQMAAAAGKSMNDFVKTKIFEGR